MIDLALLALINLALAAVLVALVGFGIGPLLGAPYLPVLRREVEGLLDLADLKAGDLLLDLGSGDGRLLKAAAKRGVRGIGYEINPALYLWSVVNCWHYRQLVKIRMANYWNKRLPEANVVYVFLINHYMAKLDQKLQREVSKPTKLVSFVFAIPGREPVKQTRNSYMYLYP